MSDWRGTLKRSQGKRFGVSGCNFCERRKPLAVNQVCPCFAQFRLIVACRHPCAIVGHPAPITGSVQGGSMARFNALPRGFFLRDQLLQRLKLPRGVLYKRTRAKASGPIVNQ